MSHQKLQYTDVMPLAGARAESNFERRSQMPERFGQVPIPHRRHMVQPRRLAFQRRHKVQRVNEGFVPAVPAPMFGHDLAAMHDLHAVDVSLDRHLRKGRSVRHAVTVSLEDRRLILIHQAGSLDAGVEAVRGDRQRRRLF
jgi:hypothetical protein